MCQCFKSNRLRIAVTIAAMVVSMSSCNIERQLAGDYLKKKDPVSMLLLAPDFIYKSSYKIPDIENFDSLPGDVRDSMLFFSSDLVQHINDSVFLQSYLKGVSIGLRQFGYTVYQPAEALSFIDSGSQALIINLAQLQLEEFFDPISDEASFGEEEQYNYELFITALNVNSWFEVSHLNDRDTLKRIFYASATYTDFFDGGFKYFPFTGDVKYYYTIDSLTVDEVCEYASSTGYQYAGYLFDYLMNAYISEQMPEGRLREQLYTYDRNSGVIRKSKGNGFTQIR